MACDYQLLLEQGSRIQVQTPQTPWWRGHRRVLFCLYGGCSCLLTTWLVCYMTWLSYGCTAWMPFVSDFGGGPTKYPFGIGMSMGALLLLPTWLDHHVVTKPLVAGRGCFWRLLHSLQPVLGVCCSLSAVGVAVNPINLRFTAHILSATGVFSSSLVFSVNVCILEALKTRRSCAVAGLAVVVATATLTLMLHFLAVGITEVKRDGVDIERRDGVDIVRRDGVELMTKDYLAYCSGESSITATSTHSNAYVNLSASCEWLYLIVVFSVVCSKLFLDLHIEPLRARRRELQKLGIA